MAIMDKSIAQRSTITVLHPDVDRRGADVKGILHARGVRGAKRTSTVCYPAILKSPLVLAVTSLLLSCGNPRGDDTSYPSPTLVPPRTAGNEVGWKTTDFTDLIKSAKADCTTEATHLLRCDSPIRIDGLTETSVIGHGVRVEFTDSRSGKGGINLVNASDVKLSDIEIGWLGGGARDLTLPGVQRIQSFGNVVNCANGESGGVLSLDVPLEGTLPLGAVSVWDEAFGWPWYRSAPNAFEVYLPNNTVATFSAGRSNCIRKLASLVGRRVLIRHVVYTNHAFHCLGCRNVTIEKVRVTSAPGMAFVFEHGGSNLILRGNVVEPKCSPRCAHPEPSVTADGAHFSGVEGNILLEDNDFGWQGDDAVNVTGLLIPARAAPEADTSGRWLIVDEQWRSRLALFATGDKALLFDQGLSPLGEAKVLSVVASTGHLKISQLPAEASDLIVADAEALPNKVVIRNNRFHDNRARGILIGGSNALIYSNVIERVTMEAILVPADTGPWYEGPGAQNVTIKDNRISDVNRFPDVRDYPSAISAGVSTSAAYEGKVGTPIRHIVVEGNSFARVYSNADVPVFFGKGVSDGQVRDNK